MLLLSIPILGIVIPYATVNALSTPPRHDFPKTKYGDRLKILESERYAQAVQFLDRVHEERYSTCDDCRILGPAWREYDDNGGDSPVLPPSPMQSLDSFTSYSREQQRDDAVAPAGSSASQLSAEFASIAKRQQGGRTAKGFGSANGDDGSPTKQTAAPTKMRRKKKRKKKWSADEDDNIIDGDTTEDIISENTDSSSTLNVQAPSDDSNKPFLTCPSLFDGNFCHVTTEPIFTAEECRAIISEANESSEDEWKSHDQYYKAMKITKRIDEMPQMREFFGRACIERIFPLLQKMYPTACPQGSDGLRDFRIFTAKVLRYDASSGNDYLGVHHDGSLLTFLIALNDLDEYEGGGTYMEALGKAVRYEAGHLCCHPGIVRHGGDKVTSGVRYVLAAWIDIHGVKEYDRQLCEEADLTRMKGRLDQTLEFNLGQSPRGAADERLVKAEQWYLYSLAAGEKYGRDAAEKDDRTRSMVPRLTSENVWLGLGQLWLDQGKSVEAADAFRNALDLSPYNTRAWISYGLALVNLDDVDGAIHAFTTAADMNEYEFDALSNLGLLYSMASRHQEAAEAYDMAIGRIRQGADGSIKADKRAAAELYTNLGVTLCDLERYREAMVVFAKAVVIDPTFHDAATNLKAVKDALGAS